MFLAAFILAAAQPAPPPPQARWFLNFNATGRANGQVVRFEAAVLDNPAGPRRYWFRRTHVSPAGPTEWAASDTCPAVLPLMDSLMRLLPRRGPQTPQPARPTSASAAFGPPDYPPIRMASVQSGNVNAQGALQNFVAATMADAMVALEPCWGREQPPGAPS